MNEYIMLNNKHIAFSALNREVQRYCLGGSRSNTWIQVRRLFSYYDDDYDDDADDDDGCDDARDDSP